jgi:hypothetical protein
LALLGRILVVLVALLCASLAASAVLTVAVLVREWNDLLLLSRETGTLAVVVGLGGVVISAVALVPALLVVTVAEAYGWRSVLVYAGLGLALALWAYHGGYDLVGPEAPLTRDAETSAAAGIAGGFVYWLLAGRRAGLWRSVPANPQADGRAGTPPA